MPTVIKAGTPAHFLSLIPHLLGYTPTESLVLIPFAGTRSIGAMRLDLPDPERFREAAHTVLGLVCKLEGAHRVEVVVYTAGDAEAYAPLCLNLERTAAHTGMHLGEVHYVDGRGYGSLLHNTGPFPLSDLVVDPEAPAIRAGDQHTVTLPDVPETVHAEVLDRIGEVDPDPTGMDVVILGEGLATLSLPPRGLACLHWLLETPAVRDVLLIQAVLGSEHGSQAWEAQLAWEDGEEYPAEIAQVMWGVGDQPDPARLTQAFENIRTLLAILPQPGAYAAAAWLAWALGKSTEADWYSAQGLAQAEDHGLCQIVQTFVNAGHLPEWAFTRRP